MKRCVHVFISEDNNGRIKANFPISTQEIDEWLEKVVNTEGDVYFERVDDTCEYLASDGFDVFMVIDTLGFGLNFKYAGTMNDGTIVLTREIDC